MLAHCALAYEMVYTDKHKAPNGFVKFMLKAFVKKGVVSEVPYKRNLRTTLQFIIANGPDFEAEKTTLVDYIKRNKNWVPIIFMARRICPFARCYLHLL
jgi:hypothetical protein